MALTLAHPIDYEALNANPLQVYGYEASASSEHTTLPFAALLHWPHINEDAFRQSFSAFSNSSPTNTQKLTLTDPVTDTRLSAYLLNPEASEDNLTGVMPTWTSSPLTNSGNQNLYSLMAAVNTDRRLLIIDTPGLGNSGTLPHDTLEELRLSGSFLGPGHIIARALEVGGFQPDRIIGNSSGGRFGAGLARALGENTVKQLHVCDAPHEAIGKIFLAFFAKEPKHRELARKVSQDTRRIVPSEGAVADFTFQQLLRHLGRAGYVQKWSEAQAFARGPLPMQDDIQGALDAHKDLHLSIVSPATSEVSPHIAKMRQLIEQLIFRGSQRARQLVIPNATHAYDDHHPLAFIASMDSFDRLKLLVD